MRKEKPKKRPASEDEDEEVAEEEDDDDEEGDDDEEVNTFSSDVESIVIFSKIFFRTKRMTKRFA